MNESLNFDLALAIKEVKSNPLIAINPNRIRKVNQDGSYRHNKQIQLRNYYPSPPVLKLTFLIHWSVALGDLQGMGVGVLYCKEVSKNAGF